MKRIFYILIATLVAFTACTKETDFIDLNQPEHDAVYPDGAYVDLQFSVPMPAATKGDMADLPIIDNESFYVAVFDGSGSLKQYEKAEFDKVTQNGRANAENFKVRLLLRSSESRLHFIANGPAKETVTGGMESTLIQQWMTDYPEAAYWQRIILPEGITAYSFSAKKKNADGTESAWNDGDQIHFWYLEREVEGKKVYDHVSEGTQGATHVQYRVNVSSSGRASYNDANTPFHVVNVGDFVDARGFKILDGTGYFQSASVTDAVESVPLVRNFARIKVKAGSGNFTPTSYYLMNIPDKGLIAPYSSEVGGFVPEYSVSRYEKDAQGTPQFVSDDPKIYTLTEGETMNHSTLLKSLTDSKYPANMPAGASLIQTVEDVEADPDIIDSWKEYKAGPSTATVEQTPSAFIFERGLPNKDQDPTYLLIGGTLEDVGTRWFKVELTDAVGKYFRIFRDMTYFLEIGQIDGAEGYESAADAAVGTPVSDVSNSLATENLEQVSDGKGTSMWVSYIDYTGTKKADDEGKGEKKAILYKVFETESGDALPAMIGSTSRYTLEFTGDAIESIITEDSAYSGSDTPDGKSDWRYAEVQLVPTSLAGIVSGELTISGITSDGEASESGKTLSRKVKYHVMPVQSLKTLTADKLASEAVNEETKLTIELPDGLGFSLFPLVLKIEFEKGNMNPVPAKNKDHAGALIDLPVEYGPSYFSDGNSFYFLFTVNYSDYYDRSNKTKPYNGKYELYFETTKGYVNASGSNETWVSVTDKNGYFVNKPTDGSSIYSDSNKAVTIVEVTGGNKYLDVTPTSQYVGPSATSASLRINTNDSWTISSTNSGVSFSPSSGTGSADVTVSFSASSSNQARTFTATITPDTGTAKQVTITQEAPSVSLISSTASVRAEETSYIMDISSNTDWTAEIVGNPGDDVTLAPVTKAAEAVSGSGNGKVKISFNANTSETNSRTIQVKVYATNNPTISATLTLTQYRIMSKKTGDYAVALNTQANYMTNNFTQNTTGTTITFNNCTGYSSGRKYYGKYIGTRTGYRQYNYINGTIIVTAPTGGERVDGKITGITITYYNGQNTQTVTYSPSGTSSSKTSWSGEEETVTVTMNCEDNTQYNARNVVSNIAVTYEYYE